ncbi:MAG: hypothetical protein KDA93_06420 [Planctomycetaceae bacterium]|nr:hypothetical protein [Planctomycetaceae bacterium]
MFDLETAIADWKQSLIAHEVLSADNIAELESHLRESVSSLESTGLVVEEAFFLAQRRIGQPSELKVEFAKEPSSTRWVRHGKWMCIGILGLVFVRHAWNFCFGIAWLTGIVSLFDPSTFGYLHNLTTVFWSWLIVLIGIFVVLRHTSLVDRFAKWLARIPKSLRFGIPICIIAVPSAFSYYSVSIIQDREDFALHSSIFAYEASTATLLLFATFVLHWSEQRRIRCVGRTEGSQVDWNHNFHHGELLRPDDASELESHSHDCVSSLESMGLAEEEARLIARFRMGQSSDLDGEFTKGPSVSRWIHRSKWMCIGVLALIVLRTAFSFLFQIVRINGFPSPVDPMALVVISNVMIIACSWLTVLLGLLLVLRHDPWVDWIVRVFSRVPKSILTGLPIAAIVPLCALTMFNIYMIHGHFTFHLSFYALHLSPPILFLVALYVFHRSELRQAVD